MYELRKRLAAVVVLFGLALLTGCEGEPLSTVPPSPRFQEIAECLRDEGMRVDVDKEMEILVVHVAPAIQVSPGVTTTYQTLIFFPTEELARRERAGAHDPRSYEQIGNVLWDRPRGIYHQALVDIDECLRSLQAP